MRHCYFPVSLRGVAGDTTIATFVMDLRPRVTEYWAWRPDLVSYGWMAIGDGEAAVMLGCPEGGCVRHMTERVGSQENGDTKAAAGATRTAIGARRAPLE